MARETAITAARASASSGEETRQHEVLPAITTSWVSLAIAPMPALLDLDIQLQSKLIFTIPDGGVTHELLSRT